MNREQLKPVRWVGTSRKDVRSFPAPVRNEIGHALYAAQKGETDPAAKPLKGFGGRGVLEIVTDHRGDTGVRSTRFASRAQFTSFTPFRRSRSREIATPKKELDLVRQRLAEAERAHRERQN